MIGKCDSDGFTSSAAVQCPHVAVEGAQGKSILTVLTRCSSARRPYDTGGKKQGWHLAGNHGATKVPVCHSNRGAGKIEPDGEESGLLKLPPPLTGPLNHCRLPPAEKWPPLGMRFFWACHFDRVYGLSILFTHSGERHEIVSVAIRIKLPQKVSAISLWLTVQGSDRLGICLSR